ncbi:hypothetical protein E2320_013263, partial [Naja naja]
MAAGDLGSGLAVVVPAVEIGELLAVIFLIFFRVVMVGSDNVLGRLGLRHQSRRQVYAGNLCIDGVSVAHLQLHLPAVLGPVSGATLGLGASSGGCYKAKREKSEEERPQPHGEAYLTTVWATQPPGGKGRKGGRVGGEEGRREGGRGEKKEDSKGGKGGERKEEGGREEKKGEEKEGGREERKEGWKEGGRKEGEKRRQGGRERGKEQREEGREEGEGRREGGKRGALTAAHVLFLKSPKALLNPTRHSERKRLPEPSRDSTFTAER